MLRRSSSNPYGSATNLGMADSSIALPIRPTCTARKHTELLTCNRLLRVWKPAKNRVINAGRRGWTDLRLSSIWIQLAPAMSPVARIQSSVTIWVDRSAGWDKISKLFFPQARRLHRREAKTQKNVHKPVAVIHVSAPVQACISIWWGCCTVVGVAHRWSVVIVTGNSISGVVYRPPGSRSLPEPHGWSVAPDSRHWTTTIKGKCVRHRGDDCASGRGLYNFLHLKVQRTSFLICIPRITTVPFFLIWSHFFLQWFRYAA